jgi:hypothetical protein
VHSDARGGVGGVLLVLAAEEVTACCALGAQHFQRWPTDILSFRRLHLFLAKFALVNTLPFLARNYLKREFLLLLSTPFFFDLETIHNVDLVLLVVGVELLHNYSRR